MEEQPLGRRDLHQLSFFGLSECKTQSKGSKNAQLTVSRAWMGVKPPHSVSGGQMLHLQMCHSFKNIFGQR